MLITIEKVLTAEQVLAARQKLAVAEWIDGRATAGVSGAGSQAQRAAFLRTRR